MNHKLKEEIIIDPLAGQGYFPTSRNGGLKNLLAEEIYWKMRDKIQHPLADQLLLTKLELRPKSLKNE